MLQKRVRVKKLVYPFVFFLILVVGALAWIFFDSTNAVNSYIDATTKQYNRAMTKSNEVGLAVELRPVIAGDLINPRYHKVKLLAGRYNELLESLKNYASVVSYNNNLSKLYNEGLSGIDTLDGEVLVTAQKYSKAVASRYPKDKDIIKNLEDLSTKIASSTEFKQVSGDIADTLNQTSVWLTGLREHLISQQKGFTNRINNT